MPYPAALPCCVLLDGFAFDLRRKRDGRKRAVFGARLFALFDSN
jgi:hypothetical protein